MSHIVIQGGRRLEGTLTVQGAKNSVLPILAATILHPGRTTLRGCPRLSDVEASIRILRHLGCKAEWEGEELTVDASTLGRWDVPDHLMREMRSSVIFLGAILARMGWAELSHPGGCELGPRPIDLHLAALRQLGAQLREESGCLQCSAQRMEGREIVLSMPSVGATENAMLAACGAEGETVLVNAAREPEIGDLQAFLCGMGCRVRGAGSSTICIQGRRPPHAPPRRSVHLTWAPQSSGTPVTTATRSATLISAPIRHNSSTCRYRFSNIFSTKTVAPRARRSAAIKIAWASVGNPG